MENDSKTGQFTFAENEKEILQKLSIFENSLNEKLQPTNGEIEQIKYYEQFHIDGIESLDFTNIYITAEKDSEGKISYHMYCKEISDEILSIDSEGNLKIKPELEAFLGDIDLEKIIEENEKEPGRLKGISEKLQPKELEGMLKNKDSKEVEEEEKDEEEIGNQIEEDLSEDLDIVSYKKINDSKLDKQVEKESGTVQEKGIAYSRRENAFVLVVKKDGKFERPEGFGKAKPTMKTVYSVDNDGKEVEKKSPHALMQTNEENEELSISIDQYGYVETGIVNKQKTGERVERQAEEQQGKDSTIKEESDRNPQGLDEQALIEREAKKSKVSVLEFQKYLGKAEGTNLAEKIQNVQEMIEEQYAPSATRRR